MKTLLLWLLLPLTVFGQRVPNAALNRYMVAASAKGFSGVLLVARQDRILYQQAVGLANREWNAPNTVGTKFRIGSITKQMTAVAIMQLVERQQLRLNDRLSTFYPDFPQGDSVTIDMLLNHTSGVRNFGTVRNFATLRALPYPQDSVVALMKKMPYDFRPGSKWAYNNSAYFLLGDIIEKVSGLSYAQYLGQHMFARAQLRNTSVNRLDSVLWQRAAGYEYAAGRWKNAPYISMEFPFSAGAVVSTAEDLLRWNRQLYAGQLISAASVARLTTPHRNFYGYGLRIDSAYHRLRIGHNGSMSGFETHNLWFPAEQLSIILLSNNEFNVIDMAENLQRLLFGENQPAADTRQLDAYAGTYRSADNALTLRFARHGQQLQFVGAEEKIDLYQLTPTTFVNGYVRRRFFVFTTNNSQPILRFTRSGLTTDLVKIE